LQALQLLEGAIVGTLDGLEAAVQAGKRGQVAVKGLAQGGGVGRDCLLPEAGFNGAIAAELSIGGD
jgi:hypothetical protein